jgi:hypothetical protein
MNKDTLNYKLSDKIKAASEITSTVYDLIFIREKIEITAKNFDLKNPILPLLVADYAGKLKTFDEQLAEFNSKYKFKDDSSYIELLKSLFFNAKTETENLIYEEFAAFETFNTLCKAKVDKLKNESERILEKLVNPRMYAFKAKYDKEYLEIENTYQKIFEISHLYPLVPSIRGEINELQTSLEAKIASLNLGKVKIPGHGLIDLKAQFDIALNTYKEALAIEEKIGIETRSSLSGEKQAFYNGKIDILNQESHYFLDNVEYGLNKLSCLTSEVKRIIPPKDSDLQKNKHISQKAFIKAELEAEHLSKKAHIEYCNQEYPMPTPLDAAVDIYMQDYKQLEAYLYQ